MRGGCWLLGLVLLGVGLPGIAAGEEPDPEAVRRLMEQYEREAAEAAAKKAPAPKPRLKPAPMPKLQPQPQPAPAVDHDREAWRSAEKCGTAACFEAYLADYPKGRYARMARARLEPEESAIRMPAVGASQPIITQPTFSAPSYGRMKATVIEFGVRGDLDEQSGVIIADLVMMAMANTGRFTLKDRLPLSSAAKIAKAQEQGSTGLLDPKTAAELGRLYGTDAVVTGEVYKLGDIVTITAQLIDTKTASLLRSGQIQGKDIDTIQAKINELAKMITAPLDMLKVYTLTIKTDPADASVRLLNSSKPYQPGIQLVAGEYEIEVTRPGYVLRKEKLRIADRDLALMVVLEKAK